MVACHLPLGAVTLPAIELHDEPVLRPVAVNPEAAYADVDERPRDAAFLTELQELAFDRALRASEIRVVNLEGPAQRGAAWLATAEDLP